MYSILNKKMKNIKFFPIYIIIVLFSCLFAVKYAIIARKVFCLGKNAWEFLG
jgi:hypothetical protein